MKQETWTCDCCGGHKALKRFRRGRRYCKKCSKHLIKVRMQSYGDLYRKFKNTGKFKGELLKKKSTINNDMACRLIFEINKTKWAIDFSLDGKRLGTSTFVRKLEELEPFEEFARSELD